MKAFETSGAVKTWILTSEGIIHSDPPEMRISEKLFTHVILYLETRKFHALNRFYSHIACIS